MRRYEVVAAVFLTACGGDATEPESLYPATVVVSPATGEMEKFADTLHLTATVRDQNGDGMDSVTVEWSTEDPLLATVTADGVVSARGGGVVGITATAGAVSDTATITIRLAQRDGLLKLYESLNGDNWIDNTNWGTETRLGAWYGVVADDNGNVIRLNLQRNDLHGEIPPEIKLVKHLRVLDLSFNDSVTGTIPPELAEMEYLRGILLHHNSLTGTIPSVLANLTGMVNFDLHRNQLTGPMPEWLGDLPELTHIGLWGNDLTGSVPASLGDLNRMVRLEIQDTDLSGPLPRSLMNLELNIFHWQDTDLCSPPDDAFQDWLDGIRFHQGGDACDP